MSKNVAYARASTKRQTTEQQTAALRAAGCDPIYAEKMSGKLNDRPQLAAALAELEPGDTLTVWKLDRLGRDALQMLNTIKLLRDKGIRLRSLTDNIDPDTASGKLMLGLLAHLAEYENDLKAERAEAKRALIRQRGGKLGGREPKFDSEQAAAIKRAHANGETVAELARTHRTSRPTIYRVLDGQR